MVKLMGMMSEFKEFAMKGSVLDLAIGIVIGGAFGKIVSSMVNDVIMPPIGLLMGKVNFADMFIALDGNTYANLAAAKAAAAPTINYGAFINVIIEFLIIAFVIFLLVKQINKMKRKPEAPPVNTKDCPYCKENIPLAAVRCPHCTSEIGGN
jgi:large conductance mechanosensitive channel